MGKVNSSTEGTYYNITISNRKEKIDLEVKMSAEDFAGLMTGLRASLPVDDKLKKDYSQLIPE
jgi:hypothetical protein